MLKRNFHINVNWRFGNWCLATLQNPAHFICHPQIVELIKFMVMMEPSSHAVPLSPYSMPSLVSGSSGLGRGGGSDIGGGGGGRLILENRHLHSPCNFNPRCLCSSGGEIWACYLKPSNTATLPKYLQPSNTEIER